jgi:hypothetical protein
MSNIRDRLLTTIKTEIPSLEYDLQNGSTHYGLQLCTQRMFRLLKVVLAEVVSLGGDSPSSESSAGRKIPPEAQTLVRRLVEPPPPPPPPASVGPILADLPTAPAGVANVVITPNGTQVLSPGGRVTRLDPGAPVEISAVADDDPLA